MTIDTIWNNWLDKRSEEDRKTIYLFTDLLLRCDALIYPRMSYGAPFLYRLGPLGYFGYDKIHGVYFGFYWGKYLVQHDSSGILQPDERKTVKIILLQDRTDDDNFSGSLLELFDRAIQIDSDRYRK